MVNPTLQSCEEASTPSRLSVPLIFYLNSIANGERHLDEEQWAEITATRDTSKEETSLSGKCVTSLEILMNYLSSTYSNAAAKPDPVDLNHPISSYFIR